MHIDNFAHALSSVSADNGSPSLLVLGAATGILADFYLLWQS